MRIEKRKLEDVNQDLIIQLLNNPLVKRHMPLSVGDFGKKDYENFIAAKKAIWTTFGFGPWAYYINKNFVGWGGIQPDEGDFEMALVIFPAYWGYGKHLYKEIIQEAFAGLRLNSVTVLFPPSRTRIKWIFKAGFLEDGQVIINDKKFIRFRLKNPNNLA